MLKIYRKKLQHYWYKKKKPKEKKESYTNGTET